MENVIEARDLAVHFTVRNKKGTSGVVRALDGVSLDIRKGEILAAVGESGCGKTTLGKAALNVFPPTEGAVYYKGRNMAKVPKKEMQALRGKLQMIFQDPYESLDSRQSIYKTLQEPLLIHRKDLKEDERRKLIYRYLDAVGLHPVTSMAQRYPHHLSGGQRQRLSIATAMILDPDFIVADEPVSMLDVSVRAEILKLILDLRGDRELTYLFITHDLSLAWMIASRIAVFYLGKMVEIGPAKMVTRHCQHPYTRALVSVVPTMDKSEKSQKRYVLSGETPTPIDMPRGCRFHPRCWYYQEYGSPEVCRAAEPEPRQVGWDHFAACHFVPQDKIMSNEV